MKRGSLVLALAVCLLASHGGPALGGEDAKAVYEEGNALLGKGDVPGAIQKYTRALELDPRLCEALNNLGIIYLGRGETAKARAQFDRALEINPKYPQGLSNAGLCCLREGNLKGATDRFLAALESDPKFVPPYLHIAKIYALGGNLEYAYKYLALAESQAPKDRDLLLTFASFSADAGNTQRALEYFSRAVAAYPKDLEILVRAGLFYIRAGAFEMAATVLSAAVSQYPEAGLPHYGMAVFHYAKQERDLAFGGFKRALELKLPKEYVPWANYYCGLIHQQNLRPETAREYLETAYRADPRNWTFVYHLASLCQDLKDNDRAEALYHEALALNSKDKDSLNNLGLMRLKTEPKEALEYFEKALAVDPGCRPALYNKGVVLLALGKNAEGAAVLAGLARQSATGDPYAVRALGLLEVAAKHAEPKP